MNRVRCRMALRLDLDAYLVGDLGEESQRRLEAHLHACADCRQELADLRVVLSALPTVAPDVPPLAVQRLKTRVTAELATRRRWSTQLAASAVLLTALVVIIALPDTPRRLPPPADLVGELELLQQLEMLDALDMLGELELLEELESQG